MTVCYRLVRLVARQALPRHVPVARHFKLVVPGVRADDLASPGPINSEFGQIALTTAEPGMVNYPLSFFNDFIFTILGLGSSIGIASGYGVLPTSKILQMILIWQVWCHVDNINKCTLVGLHNSPLHDHDSLLILLFFFQQTTFSF